MSEIIINHENEIKSYPFRSWVNGFIKSFYRMWDVSDFNGFGIGRRRNTAGSSLDYTSFLMGRVSVNTSLGSSIIVGSNTQAVSFGNLNIVSPITNLIAQNPVVTLEDNSGRERIVIERRFSNSTGSVITINEVGLTLNVPEKDGSAEVLMSRDVVSPINLNDGQSVIITMKFDLPVTFTKNFIRYIYAGFKGAHVSGNPFGYGNPCCGRMDSGGSYEIKDAANNNAGKVTMGLFNQSNLLNILDPAVCGIALGSSDTPETYTDYSLTEITDLTRKNEFFKMTLIESSGTEQSFKVTQNYQNDNAYDVTIREIGLFSANKHYNTSTPCSKVLMMRKVLSTPIVLKPGDDVLITFKFKIDLA